MLVPAVLYTLVRRKGERTGPWGGARAADQIFRHSSAGVHAAVCMSGILHPAAGSLASPSVGWMVLKALETMQMVAVGLSKSQVDYLDGPLCGHLGSSGMSADVDKKYIF